MPAVFFVLYQVHKLLPLHLHERLPQHFHARQSVDRVVVQAFKHVFVRALHHPVQLLPEPFPHRHRALPRLLRVREQILDLHLQLLQRRLQPLDLLLQSLDFPVPCRDNGLQLLFAPFALPPDLLGGVLFHFFSHSLHLGRHLRAHLLLGLLPALGVGAARSLPLPSRVRHQHLHGHPLHFSHSVLGLLALPLQRALQLGVLLQRLFSALVHGTHHCADQQHFRAVLLERLPRLWKHLPHCAPQLRFLPRQWLILAAGINLGGASLRLPLRFFELFLLLHQRHVALLLLLLLFALALVLEARFLRLLGEHGLELRLEPVQLLLLVGFVGRDCGDLLLQRRDFRLDLVARLRQLHDFSRVCSLFSAFLQVCALPLQLLGAHLQFLRHHFLRRDVPAQSHLAALDVVLDARHGCGLFVFLAVLREVVHSGRNVFQLRGVRFRELLQLIHLFLQLPLARGRPSVFFLFCVRCHLQEASSSFSFYRVPFVLRDPEQEQLQFLFHHFGDEVFQIFVQVARRLVEHDWLFVELAPCVVLRSVVQAPAPVHELPDVLQLARVQHADLVSHRCQLLQVAAAAVVQVVAEELVFLLQLLDHQFRMQRVRGVQGALDFPHQEQGPPHKLRLKLQRLPGVHVRLQLAHGGIRRLLQHGREPFVALHQRPQLGLVAQANRMARCTVLAARTARPRCSSAGMGEAASGTSDVALI
mmetsp:Transcript_13868/g.34240  ORF Transcript_13868/g.34240 Transcript_13868/m.34240 type:complete len:702 (-) Transcript_13868:724-2829(-)